MILNWFFVVLWAILLSTSDVITFLHKMLMMAAILLFMKMFRNAYFKSYLTQINTKKRQKLLAISSNEMNVWLEFWFGPYFKFSEK